MYSKETIGFYFWVAVLCFTVAVSVVIGVIFGIPWGVAAFMIAIAVYAFLVCCYAYHKNMKELQ